MLIFRKIRGERILPKICNLIDVLRLVHLEKENKVLRLKGFSELGRFEPFGIPALCC